MKLTLITALLTALVATEQSVEVKCFKNAEKNGSGIHYMLPTPITEATENFEFEAIIQPPTTVIDHGLRCAMQLSANPEEAGKGNNDSFRGELNFYKGISKHATLMLGGKEEHLDNWSRLPYGTAVLTRLKYEKNKGIFTVSFYADGKLSASHSFALNGRHFEWRYCSIISISKERENISDSCFVRDIKINGQEILPAEMQLNIKKNNEEKSRVELENYLNRDGGKGLPVKGFSLFNTFDWNNFPCRNSSYANYSRVSATGREFSVALRMEGLKKPEAFHTVQIASVRNEQPIKKGDVIFLRFDGRCLRSSDESGTGQIQILLVADSKTWESFGGAHGYIDREWKTCYGAGIAPRDYPTGTVRLQVYLSHLQQTVELGGIVAQNLGSAVDIKNLPKTKIEYKERPSTAWRKAAEKRIETIRKNNFTLTLSNPDGTVISNAEIMIELKKHAYGFGCYTDDSPLLDDNQNGEKFRQEFKRLFNRAIVPMFWGPGDAANKMWGWENPRFRQRYMENAKWCHDNDILVQAHVLVWPAAIYAPPDVNAIKNDSEKLQNRINEHITDVINANRNNVAEYQVLNEPLGTIQFSKIVGTRGTAEWFKTARRNFPNGRLLINDNGIISRFDEKRKNYETLIRQLIADGAPIDGIGFQGHIGTELPGPERIWNVFDSFAEFNLPIYITEFTVMVGDEEELQSEYTRDFLTACFSHPASEAVIQWGFWAGKHYNEKCALYRKNWEPRPNGLAYEELIFKTWHTKCNGQTDRQGRFSGRGFQGEYSGRVVIDGKPVNFSFRITKDSPNQINVKIVR